MDPHNDLEQFIKNVELKTNPETDASVLVKMLSVQEKPQETDSAVNVPGFWRNIMKSKMTKYVAAAVIVIGILVMISMMGGSPDGAGVVWAKVAEKIDQIDTAIHKRTMTVTEWGDESPTTTTGTCYYSRKYGFRSDYGSGEDKLIRYYSSADNTCIVWQPRLKGCLRFIYPDADEFEKRSQRGNPRYTLKKLLTKSEYTELGRSEINGVSVEGIEFTLSEDDELQEGTGRLWVEVGTDLPVYFEMEGVLVREDRNQSSPVKIVMEDFQWNAEIGEDIMPLKLPDDIIYRDSIVEKDKAVDGAEIDK